MTPLRRGCLALCLPALLLPPWIYVLETFVKSDTLAPARLTSKLPFRLWLLPPLLVTLTVLIALAVWGRIQTQRTAQRQQAARQARADREAAEARSRQAAEDRQHFTLEVLGVGLILEEVQHQKVWLALDSGGFRDRAVRRNPADVPWAQITKEQQRGDRSNACFLQAFGSLRFKWECPILQADAWRPTLDRQMERNPGDTFLFRDLNLFRLMFKRVHDTPDALLLDAFQLFDRQTDLPLVAMSVGDGEIRRNRDRPSRHDLTPAQVRSLPARTRFSRNLDGPLPEDAMTESFVAFALGRRDRVDALRPFAFSMNPNQVPHPLLDLKAWPKVPDGNEYGGPKVVLPPLPIPEQAEALARFQPTRWFRRPWAHWQLAQFDARPVLAHLHRPQRIDFQDAKGQRMGSTAKVQALLEAWKRALATLPEGQRPQRLFFDAGGPSGSHRLAPFLQALHLWDPDVDPLANPHVDLSLRLGDTGAASPFVAVALAVYTASMEQKTCACISLRDDAHATLLMVSPPTVKEHRRNLKAHPWAPEDWIPEDCRTGLREPAWVQELRRPGGE